MVETILLTHLSETRKSMDTSRNMSEDTVMWYADAVGIP